MLNCAERLLHLNQDFQNYPQWKQTCGDLERSTTTDRIPKLGPFYVKQWEVRTRRTLRWLRFSGQCKIPKSDSIIRAESRKQTSPSLHSPLLPQYCIMRMRALLKGLFIPVPKHLNDFKGVLYLPDQNPHSKPREAGLWERWFSTRIQSCFLLERSA